MKHSFQGKFFYCTDLSKMTEAECQGQYFEYRDSGIYVQYNPLIDKDLLKTRTCEYTPKYRAYIFRDI